jgi:hypothetical protein
MSDLVSLLPIKTIEYADENQAKNVQSSMQTDLTCLSKFSRPKRENKPQEWEETACSRKRLSMLRK